MAKPIKDVKDISLDSLQSGLKKSQDKLEKYLSSGDVDEEILQGLKYIITMYQDEIKTRE